MVGHAHSIGDDGGCVIRPAVAGDAAQLAEVHTQAWKVAYRGIFSDAFLDSLDVEDRTRRWERTLADDGGDAAAAGTHTVVAVIDGRVWGFSSWGPARDADRVGLGELWACNVHPDAWRCGIGSALMAETFDGLRRGRYPAATLWVLAGNPAARRFYEAHGWTPTEHTRTETRFDATRPAVEIRHEVQLTLAG